MSEYGNASDDIESAAGRIGSAARLNGAAGGAGAAIGMGAEAAGAGGAGAATAAASGAGAAAATGAAGAAAGASATTAAAAASVAVGGPAAAVAVATASKAGGGIIKFLVTTFIIGNLFIIGFILLVTMLVSPKNVLYFSAQAAGEAVTHLDEFVGQKLKEAQYSFMTELYEFSETLENYVYTLLHSEQASKTQEILNELDAHKIVQSSEEDRNSPYSGYTDGVDSLLVLMDGTFRKGWARTQTTALMRAEMVKEDKATGNIEDTYYDKVDPNNPANVLFDKEAEWEKWEAQKPKDHYRAGTFNYNDGNNYSGQYTGEDTIINITPPQGDEQETPPYLYAELQLIALQNAAEQAVITTENEDGTKTNTFGITNEFDDETVEPKQMASTEYQILRLAGEIAGRGIQLQDINDKTHAKEKISLYNIVCESNVYVSYKTYPVEIEYWTGAYERKKVTDYDIYGNVVSEKWVRGDKIMAWKLDHYDVAIVATAITKYHVEVKPDCKNMIIQQMMQNYTKDENTAFTPEEQTAFLESVNSYYDVNYKFLCDIYKVDGKFYGEGAVNGSEGWIEISPEDAAGYVPSEGFCWPLPAGGGWSRGFMGKAHRGVDWHIAGGTPIYASADGIVTVAQYHYSWGNHVRIKHDNGTLTLYAHMIQAPSVVAGQTVHQGDVIGFVGSTGESTGNHLHFEVWSSYTNGSSIIDPCSVVSVPAH